jgi:hypothetical protein
VLIGLTALALVGVVVAAVQYRGDEPVTYAPIGNDRPPGLAMPNRAISPGLALDVGVAEICVSGYASKTRDVSAETKRQVYAEYGITHHDPGAYEVDHIIPLSLGGSNDIKNLFPEPAEPRPGFHEKDEVELGLHDLVCAGKVDLATAQEAIATDWYAAYLKYVLQR